MTTTYPKQLSFFRSVEMQRTGNDNSIPASTPASLVLWLQIEQARARVVARRSRWAGASFAVRVPS